MTGKYEMLAVHEFNVNTVQRMAADQGIEGEDLVNYYLDHLIARYAFLSNSNGGAAVDIVNGKKSNMQSFERKYAQLRVAILNEETDKVSWVDPVKLWISAPTRATLDGFSYLPANEDMLVERKGPHGSTEMHLNEWSRPFFEDEPTEKDIKKAAKCFDIYMKHLFPIKAEREHMMNWVARLVQHPNERGVAVVHVTRTTGTGREVFYSLMSKMVGKSNVTKIEMEDLLKTRGNSFNSKMANKVFWFLNEAMTEGKDRIKGQNNIKAMIAPDGEDMRVEKKYMDAYDDKNYASTFIASNNPRNAVPIEANNRRVVVFEGPKKKLEHNKQAMDAIDRLLPRDESPQKVIDYAEVLIAALYAHLMRLETSSALFRKVIETEALEVMRAGGEGAYEIALGEILETVQGPVAMFPDIVQQVAVRVNETPQKVRGQLAERLSHVNDSTDGEWDLGYKGWFMEEGARRARHPDGIKEFPKATKVTDVANLEKGARVEGMIVRVDQYAHGQSRLDATNRGHLLHDYLKDRYTQSGSPKGSPQDAHESATKGAKRGRMVSISGGKS